VRFDAIPDTILNPLSQPSMGCCAFTSLFASWNVAPATACNGDLCNGVEYAAKRGHGAFLGLASLALLEESIEYIPIVHLSVLQTFLPF